MTEEGLRYDFDSKFIEGDIEVIEVDDGFYIIELSSIYPPKIMSYEDSLQKAINEVRAQKADELIAEMIQEDLNEAKKEYLLKNKGFSVVSPKE